MAFTVTDIGSYVQANEDKLIGKAIVGAKTAAMLNLQTGVKGTANLNLLTATTGLQDGSSCGFSASGGVTVSKRQIVTKLLKVNQTFCDKDLIGSSLQWGVKIAAGMETIPFEEMFIGQIVGNVNKEVETAIWQANTSITGQSYGLSLFDGLLKILSGGTVDGSVSGAALSGTNANVVTVINNIILKIPDSILDRNDLVIFVGYDVYRKYIAGLQAANLFHYTADINLGQLSTIVPGTNVRLEGVYGLNGTNKAVCTYTPNLYLGTDLENAQEVFKFWYSDDDDLFKLKILLNLGTQVAFPDLVVTAS